MSLDADLALAPGSEEELRDVICSTDGPLRVIGGGTRPIGSFDGRPLTTASLAGITLYEPGALTLVVRAGTTLSDVEAALAAEGQRLPFEPMDHRTMLRTEGEPTIGAVAAANISGPRRLQVGAARDFMLGVRFVDGTGAIVKNGGRVMKNVTGYDLVKLMAGSWGTLGVLTEIAFKVLPAPAAAATLTIEGLTFDRAVDAMAKALGSPFEISGAAHDPARGTLLRIEGFEESIAYRAAKLSDLMAPFGAVHVERDIDRIAEVWREVRDVVKFAESGRDIWRISVRPSRGPDVARRLEEMELLLDWGGGLIWASVPEGTDVRARLDGVGGHATIIRASHETHSRLGTFPPQPPALAALTKNLRHRFDPRGLLNQGLMG